MTEIWVADWDADRSFHDTEREAASVIAQKVQSKTSARGVWFRVVVEPPIRLGYWERAKGAAA